MLVEAEVLREDKESFQMSSVQLQRELDECKSLLTIAEYTKENEIEAERRRCQEEIASLQRIMEGLRPALPPIKTLVS